MPIILYYAKFKNTTEGRKTPKYTVISQWGYYPPMEELKGRDGLISMNLVEKLKEGENVPAMRLQAKNSLNFTGLKEYFIDGKLSGYAYGYPSDVQYYSSKKRLNPFFEHRNDGYLFIVNTDGCAPTNIIPTGFEMIVLEGGRTLIPSYCKQFIMGGFDEALKEIRQSAQTIGLDQ